MKQKLVGSYYLGHEQVDLFLREDVGAEYYFTPESGRLPRIKVGADYKNWEEVVAALLHECMEFAMDRAKCRYDPTSMVTKDHSQYLFVMDHVTFSDCCGRTAEFIAKALPDLAREWKKWK